MRKGNAAVLDLDTYGGLERPWKRAACWLLFLGPFFFFTYGLANWHTARLPHVGTLRFDWERHIPFWDWSIVPYMSIDVFYALSLFLCTRREELDAHAKRLLMATLVSVTGFLLFPLRFELTRPGVDGFYGTLFDLLTGFDKPFNQAPSLHISLLIILWVVYARYLPAILRWPLHLWFFLIGISVFTTFQHHAIDGITGAVVGIVCLYSFPDPPRQWQAPLKLMDSKSAVLRWAYLAAAIVLLLTGAAIGGWAWLLLWPTLSLMLVSLAYGPVGPSVFQKRQGRFSLPAALLLAPYMIGAWLSSRWFTRDVPGCVALTNQIWIGRVPSKNDLAVCKAVALLDLTAEFPGVARYPQSAYLNVPMLDLVAPPLPQLVQAVNALDALLENPPVLAHCALGYSRSALVACAWLLRHAKADSPAKAIAMVSAVRPQIVLPASFVSLLHDFHATAHPN